jgi:hypothetical protein
MDFPRNLMVKQYVAQVRGRWCTFRVFTTGDERFYLGGLHIPILKTDLKRDVRRALANGWGNA